MDHWKTYTLTFILVIINIKSIDFKWGGYYVAYDNNLLNNQSSICAAGACVEERNCLKVIKSGMRRIAES